ncbi:MAG: metallophosphoesterase [Hyphomicrobiales bacterium]|jgi:Icc-related predicted phosphoesterase
MTRIWILSDLHDDAAPFAWPTPPEHDVLVVAGDACERLPRALAWLRETAPTTAPIVYVPGNHDAWRTRWPRDLGPAHEQAQALGIHLLAEGEAVEICGTRFIGATLWTDFAINPRLTALARSDYDQGLMRDRQRITTTLWGGYSRWLSRDVIASHRTHRSAIADQLAAPFAGPTVVVTHHAPHPHSLRGGGWSEPLDGAYASDLGDLLARPDAPALWIHGHVHESSDYRAEGTRILCNPRGYATENPEFDARLVVTL